MGFGDVLNKVERANDVLSGKRLGDKINNKFNDFDKKLAGVKGRSDVQKKYDNLFDDEKRLVDSWSDEQKIEYNNFPEKRPEKLSKRVEEYLAEFAQSGNETDPNHIVTADDFSGDLTNPVSVFLDDQYDEEYYKDYAEYEPDENELCAECKKPFRDVKCEYQPQLDSFQKDHPCKKDKFFYDTHYCSEECARKGVEKRYPGAFITTNHDEFRARMMAFRKNSGTESFADKIANKASAAQKKTEARFQAMDEKKKAKEENARSWGLLGKLFPFLTLIKKK